MLQHAEDITSSSTTIPSLPGTVTFRKAVIETEHPADFLMGIECGQACFVGKGTLITRQMLTKLCLELIEGDEDIPKAYYMGYLVGFIDALLHARKAYPCGYIM